MIEWQIPIQIPSLPVPIRYTDKILLMGSCFTEHIGDGLQDLKFNTLQNPHGILFDPASVAAGLLSYIQQKHYKAEELVYLNELWQSWQHHSRFSGIDQETVLEHINRSQDQAHAFLREADWLIITLGTAFSYRLTENGMPVANCHRAPGTWFQKHLQTIEEINTILDNCLYQLFHFNPGLRIIFTVSPVRHIRDGVVDNNRNKARLLEVIHHLVNKFDKLYYFPAYELVIDVLRDYRFYTEDLVHPNKTATRFVMEQFMEACFSEDAKELAASVQKINAARRHKPFHASTEAHKKFLQTHLELVKALGEKYPFLPLQEEMAYFSGA